MREGEGLDRVARVAISLTGFLIGLFGLLWWQQRQDEQLLNEMEPYPQAGAGTPVEQQRSSDEDLP